MVSLGPVSVLVQWKEGSWSLYSLLSMLSLVSGDSLVVIIDMVLGVVFSTLVILLIQFVNLKKSRRGGISDCFVIGKGPWMSHVVVIIK